jgi:hypothetical protein
LGGSIWEETGLGKRGKAAKDPNDALTLNAQIAAQKRFPKIDVFYLNLHVVYLPLRLLRAVESASRP